MITIIPEAIRYHALKKGIRGYDAAWVVSQHIELFKELLKS